MSRSLDSSGPVLLAPELARRWLDILEGLRGVPATGIDPAVVAPVAAACNGGGCNPGEGGHPVPQGAWRWLNKETS